ncbi:MFS transporter, partial [Streptomyces sp. SID11233]|nr:MFS transporter [Streptomyces sp. SID11233]
LPLATAIAGPVESAVGRSAALWGCSGLILLLTLAVLGVPEVRNLRRAPAAAVPVPVLPVVEEGLPETMTTPG